MTVVRAGLAVSAALAVPTLMATPHLASTPDADGARRYEARKFSQLAVAGMQLYIAHCEECHGRNAAGTDIGPSLHHKVYQRANLGQRGFHEAISNGVAEQRWSYGDMPKTNLTFNEIEQVSRYVRDVQRGVTFR